MISEKGLDDGPVFAVNNIEVPENVSSLLAYSAACILELKQNMTFPARAYFGADGNFNALIDPYGVAHYLSQDLLNVTKPGTDYAQFIKNNITLIKDVSKIAFINMGGPDPAGGTDIEDNRTQSSHPDLHHQITISNCCNQMQEWANTRQ